MACSSAGRESPELNRPNMRRGSFDKKRPSMSDVRIVLLGKSVSENSRVGNFLLGRAAFDSEAHPDVVERLRGRLKDRHVMIINSPQLLQTNISDDQITQTVRECVSLSDPGPHVFILVLQYNDFTKKHLKRVKIVLKEFSKDAIKRTILITTDEATRSKRASWKVTLESELIRLSTDCEGRHVQLNNETEKWLSDIDQWIEKILRDNSEEFLKCDYDYAEGSSVDKDPNTTSASPRTKEDPDSKDDEQHQDTHTEMKKSKRFARFMPLSAFLGYTEQSPKQNQPRGVVSDTRQQRLNMVLCGSDETLKASVSNYIRKEKKKKLRISLVELPALNRLSEEEAMSHAHRCVSRCDPGVHVFLLVIPAGPLNNEDKAEMENIQKIFSSRINKHLMVLIIQEESMISNLNILHTSVTKTSIQTLGGHHFVLENSSQVPDLLQDVENMVQENKGSSYTTFMYLQDRVELERNKHRAEIEELRKYVMKTQSTAAGVRHDEDLRIVLLGKTGVGKSATGNTILRRDMFESIPNPSSVTRECQKETSEFNRRRITVIDTPGLFDTGVDNDEIWKEIVKCVSMAAPGPHVFLLVLQLGRFTQEEKDAVKMILETFGDKSRMYTIVLFTRGDELRGTTIEDYVQRNDSLKNLVHQFGDRYHVFNNMENKDYTQVSDLLDKIDWMLTVNGGSFYTNVMFQQVEKNIKDEQERIMKEKEEEIKRNEEELKTKYEAEMEHMKKEKERERQEMQNELRRTEEEFKKREEEIKKETNETLRDEMKRKLEEHKKQIEEENERKEKSLGEMQQSFIKLLEEKHEKDKHKLQEKIQCEAREQAECEFSEKLMKEVNKALEDAEAKLPYTAKRARDWNRYVPILGGAAGGAVGGVEDIVQFFGKIKFKRQAQSQTEG
ncbi:GTPase IMAP family member 8-like isoform X1 [Megalobrama amblycephala]|uniref:GTPase IMAP family member 8-like isoform X1 n=1 Tax=Megalobrama amblycephala TaxID=75352 RepID=UPI0020146EDD|nr:GTPase IMAP family member 8-like isoform X1 [Megalobrama amblycephala]